MKYKCIRNFISSSGERYLENQIINSSTYESLNLNDKNNFKKYYEEESSTAVGTLSTDSFMSSFFSNPIIDSDPSPSSDSSSFDFGGGDFGGGGAGGDF
jgi:hypothetical protein